MRLERSVPGVRLFLAVWRPEQTVLDISLKVGTHKPRADYSALFASTCLIVPRLLGVVFTVEPERLHRIEMERE